MSSTMPSTSSENKAEATNQAPTAMVPEPEKSKGLLDLNTATLEQLDKLPGIGESKARAILEYRSKKGSFKRVEELMDVKGIGEKMFEKLKGQVFVAPS
ncbi:ComE operon protein 1 [compost metagenome]